MLTITEIIENMTLEEKAALLTGATPWTTTPIIRLGVPEMTVTDGPHGVRRGVHVNSLISDSLPATCFPTASCLASTWDVNLMREMGQALAQECIALKVDVLLGPGVNMKRTPLCGRNFEYFSEDPYLAGQIAAGFIDGVQSQGVGTSIKHFAVNNQETRRLSISAEVDERTLREIYLPAFETAVKKSRPWTVMCAYNKVNGTYCSENQELLVDILKHEWGFEGLVMSDWGAVHDRVASLRGGLDLEMPGPRELRTQAVIEAVRTSAVKESVLDESVRRILNIVFKAAETKKGGTFDAVSHHALARKIAAQGMVLLKNNGILPLGGQKRIVVIGQAAKSAYFQGGGSSHINPTRLDNPFDELQKLAGESQLDFTRGYPEDESYDQELIDEAVNIAREAEVALLYISMPKTKDSEGKDRPDLDLTAHKVALIQAVSKVQPNNVVILNNGSALVMSDWIDGAAAVLEAWMMGQAGGGAIADVVFGRVNPSGKLAETFPIKLADTPAYLNFPGGNDEVHYGEGIFIGYRYYDAKEVPVLFPFGHGLSYTTFSFDHPRVSAASFRDVDGITVSVEVTNTGELPGNEVVQVYVHDHKSGLARPPKELKGFAKVALQPGETRDVSIPLDFRAFAYYHPGYKQWICENGEFDILIGASSADIRCTLTVTLQSSQDLPSLLKRDSTLRDWLEDRRGINVFLPFVQEISQQIQAQFVGDGLEHSGMDPMSFLMDMPLVDLLQFLGGGLQQAPEEMVDGLLAEVDRTD